MSGKHLYLLALAAVIGCGSHATPRAVAVPRKSNILTATEVTNAHADVNTAYDAVARLRPNWLASRGPVTANTEGSSFAAVFVDGQLYGDINSLRTIQAHQVADFRYYDVTQAGARFGIRAGGGGAIEVRLK